MRNFIQRLMLVAMVAMASVSVWAVGNGVSAPFTSVLNGPSEAGSKVDLIAPAVDLYTVGEVGSVDQNKLHLYKDGAPFVEPVYAGFFNNHAFVNFMGSGWTEDGVYTLKVEAGAIMIGGVACAAVEFSWTIGGAEPCAAAEATDDVAITAAVNGNQAAGATLEQMDLTIELTCDAKGLSKCDTDMKPSLMVGSENLTDYLGSWSFNCNTISCTLKSNTPVTMGGVWKLILPEYCFLNAAEELGNQAAEFSWTVVPAVPAVAPEVTGGVNNGNAAGSKVGSLANDFTINLSVPSVWNGYGVMYQFDGVSDFSAQVVVSMAADQLSANVNVTNVDLTREGKHSIYITAGAFVHANDGTKSMADGKSLDWVLGQYSIRDVRNGGVVGHMPNTADEVDRPFFQNQFTVTVSAASEAANPFVATLKKDGEAYLSNAKVTATSATEFVVEFLDWPHSIETKDVVDGEGVKTGTIDVTTYTSLDPANYTLTIAAGDFVSDADTNDEWVGTWHVVNMVYAWSLDVKGCVNGSSTTPDQKKKELVPSFTIAFQSGLSNARVGEEKICLLFQPESGAESDTLFAEPTTIACSNSGVTVTFGTEKLTGNGSYTVVMPKNAILASYVPDGGSMLVESGNASGSFTWTVENNYSFTMPESGWATYTVDYKSQWPMGCTVYYVAAMKEGKVLLQQARFHAGESDERNAYMPAYTPLLVSGAAGQEYTVYRPIDEAYMTDFAENLLLGSVEGEAASESYVLDGNQFVKKNEAHAAHSAWLPVDGLNSETLSFYFTVEEYDTATAVENVMTSDKAEKMLVNGQIVIVRQGEMYSVQGAKL